MTAAAWWMLGTTWLVVATISARLFWRVVTRPPDDRSAEPPSDPGPS